MRVVIFNIYIDSFLLEVVRKGSALLSPVTIGNIPNPIHQAPVPAVREPSLGIIGAVRQQAKIILRRSKTSKSPLRGNDKH